LALQVAHRLRLPCFPARSEHLTLLESPAQFFNVLKEKIGKARSSIYLASLYIGKDETELLDLLRATLRQTPALKVFILVDALRSTREPHPQPSGASMLATLHREFPGQVKVHLFQTPKLSWIMKLLGKRLNEGAGLQHMKVYAFDDDVIISGANLAKDYFTDRQDRYVLIEKHVDLVAYFRKLLDATAKYSYTLQSVSDSAGASLSYRLVWPRAPQASKTWAQEACQHMQRLTAVSREQTIAKEVELGHADTMIVPLLQMGPLGICQETSAVPLLFKHVQQQDDPAARLRPVLNLTSGYFSLYAPYKALVLASTFAVRIITAAPQSNGFFMSDGVSGYVADSYTRLQTSFWKELKAAGRASISTGAPEGKGNVEIREWKREGWTYHAKGELPRWGFWLTPPGSADPEHTLIGSSNFGSRSATLDLECTLLISTASPRLRTQLKKEVDALSADAKDVFDDAFLRQEADKMGRRNTLFVRFGTWLIRNML
ncbi:hypothetical protein K437DRAFT_211491, partial [Tilletiaria anomala UBC 951]